MPVEITDLMIELAARNILRAEGVSWIEMDREWQADVARYREMCAKHPDYVASRGQLHDAFRAARAALSAALSQAAEQPVAWPDWTVSASETAREVLSYLGSGSDESLEPGADRRRDNVARIITAYYDRLRSSPPCDSRTEALEEALRKCRATLAMMVEPGAITGSTITHAYASAVEAVSVADRALSEAGRSALKEEGET